MPPTEKPLPSVETELGRALRDICKIGEYANMSEEKLHAALLGQIGVCAACWGKPPYYSPQYGRQAPMSSGAATAAESKPQSPVP